MTFFNKPHFSFRRKKYHSKNRRKYGGWYRTKRGHFVKSQAELELANYFADHHEYYRYEKPLNLDGKKIKPDFYLPNRGRAGIYVEYQGMSGFRWGRKRYDLKQRIYDHNHVPVVNLYPSQFGNLGKSLMAKISSYF